MLNKKVSIIIPSYNREDLISFTLDSVKIQTFPDWECLIIDDGSSDNTITIVKEYIKKDSRFRLFERDNTKTKGPSSCRNIGIENATGDYVIFLDSDDLISSDCLQNRLKFSQQHPEADLWIFKTVFFLDSIDNQKEIVNTVLENYTDEEYFKIYSEGSFAFCILSPLWKLSVLKELGGFDEKLNIHEDPELHFRVFLNKYKSETDSFGKIDTFYRVVTKRFEITKKENEIKHYQYFQAQKYFIYKHFRTNSVYMRSFVIKFYNNKMILLGTFSECQDFFNFIKKQDFLSFKQKTYMKLLLVSKFFKMERIIILGSIKCRFLMQRYFRLHAIPN